MIEFPILIAQDSIRYSLFGTEISTSLDHISIGWHHLEGYQFEYLIPVQTSVGEIALRFKVWTLQGISHFKYVLYRNEEMLYEDHQVEGGKIEKYNQDFYFKCCATCKWGGKFLVSAEGYFCFEKTAEDRQTLLDAPKYPYTWEVRENMPSLLATHSCHQFELRPGHPAMSVLEQE
ncbi:hypothetical protein [Deinococcus cellulosilyticus]|uniref:Uncharacterized protein n=1 Tax=Deinococcus cellulosilyticus (strain DSM 18568 / NBRC 106333 / KACC 11606 / 5516J-15) TaxID=1223518 RepID=A0A511MXH2_DEIC1|nr:hypothetical protein [Deinococcus cellulosilyticus]GEM44847.1 hypothetical protein DC3_04820 [Deinococcus cellulosilyticus NBRC 106333 = KACC 11606]